MNYAANSRTFDGTRTSISGAPGGSVGGGSGSWVVGANNSLTEQVCVICWRSVLGGCCCENMQDA